MKPCVCLDKGKTCSFQIEGNKSCTREEGHSGEHVACGIHTHYIAVAPNLSDPLSVLKNKLEKLDTTAKAIQSLQRQAEDLFEKNIKPMAKEEREIGWLWDFCFNPSQDDEYSRMVLKNVIEILNK